MPQKAADAISKSYELCSQGVKAQAEIAQLIAEARQTIAVSKAVIDRLNRLDGPLRDL